MVKKRKGQGLSFNVIILAILALIVLVVLITIFSKQSGESISTLESCAGRNGDCEVAKECDSNEFQLKNAKCPNENEICCVSVFDEK